MSRRIWGRSALAVDPLGSAVGANGKVMSSPYSNSGPENKRAAARWALRLPCRFGAEGEWRKGMITDLSRGGAFVESEDCPLAGGKVTLQVSIASRTFELPGVVRHSGWFLQQHHNGHGFGVEFLGLGPIGRALVDKIVDRLNTPAPIKTTLEP